MTTVLTSAFITTIDTPVGPLVLAADPDGALTHVLFEGESYPLPTAGARRDAGPFRDVVSQLEQYFVGARRDFDLPLAPQGTGFQLAAWWALREIPYGETRSYAGQARAIGRPDAVRAVGAANGRNPISIIVPCHRVVGADGSLTGYGGGLERKRWLLEHERASCQTQLLLG
ncbi:MAG: methylated-DNA--[protein]-cysteine S-methyltransferase [Kineosporiaceae bacterium]